MNQANQTHPSPKPEVPPPFRFGPLFRINPNLDREKEKARRIFLIFTAAQIIVTLLLLGGIGIFIWRVLTLYR